MVMLRHVDRAAKCHAPTFLQLSRACETRRCSAELIAGSSGSVARGRVGRWPNACRESHSRRVSRQVVSQALDDM